MYKRQHTHTPRARLLISLSSRSVTLNLPTPTYYSSLLTFSCVATWTYSVIRHSNIAAGGTLSQVLNDRSVLYLSVRGAEGGAASVLDVSGHLARLRKRDEALRKKLEKLEKAVSAKVCVCVSVSARARVCVYVMCVGG